MLRLFISTSECLILARIVVIGTCDISNLMKLQVDALRGNDVRTNHKEKNGMSRQTFEFRPPSEEWYAAALEAEQNYTGEISAGIPITHPEQFVSRVQKAARGSKGLSLFAIGFGIAALSGLILTKLIG